jgi:hypothetical protein
MVCLVGDSQGRFPAEAETAIELTPGTESKVKGGRKKHLSDKVGVPGRTRWGIVADAEH